MNRYLKLANFEFNRIAKVFLVFLVVTLISQIVGVIVVAKTYLNEANDAMNEQFLTQAEFLSQSGPMSMMSVVYSLWFTAPIALCAAAVAFYIFLIWYRDWFGKNTFAYRLLTLPTARLNVFFAKITTILLMTFGFVAFQLILIPLESILLKRMVPQDFRVDMSLEEIISTFEILYVIIPNSMTEFILYYGTGLMAVAILFTAILFERSYRMKGIFLGAVYSSLAIIMFISPLLVDTFLMTNFFYTSELLVLMIATGLIVFFGSLWLSRFLLKNKITV